MIGEKNAGGARRGKRLVIVGSGLSLLAAPGCLGLFAAAALANAIPCDGKFIDEIQSDEGLSEECRADLEPYMEDPEQNFDGRVVLLGSEVDAGGNRSMYLHGSDDSGRPLQLADFERATVVVTTAEGEEVELSPAELSVRATGDSTESLVSLALVNDYSGSMLDHDLDNVEGLQLDVVECLPPSTEASVTFFSDEAEVRLDFTEDRDRLASAVARDDAYERSLTALYDGMGTALDELTTRERPVRILMVSSDGLENASTEWSKSEVLDTVRDEGITVVMLGALFADLYEMDDLTRHDGVFFYTPFYDDMGEFAAEYIQSLKTMVELTVPGEYVDATSISVVLDGEVVTELQPATP